MAPVRTWPAGGLPPPSSQIGATTFNEILCADVFHVKVDEAPYRIPVLSMVDLASRFLQGRAVQTESSDEIRKALERGWVRQFWHSGSPSG